jgi:hypothetical protein
MLTIIEFDVADEETLKIIEFTMIDDHIVYHFNIGDDSTYLNEVLASVKKEKLVFVKDYEKIEQLKKFGLKENLLIDLNSLGCPSYDKLGNCFSTCVFSDQHGKCTLIRALQLEEWFEKIVSDFSNALKLYF